MKLVRPKPKNEAQAALWKRLLDGTLATPDTWEVGLSGGADKRETFTRLLKERVEIAPGKTVPALGYSALLRNLRNMVQAGVDQDLIVDRIIAREGARKVLPFRYVAAARACPQLEPYLDQAMAAAIAELPELPGTTFVLVDVSGSMGDRLSDRSSLTRMEAGAALAGIVNSPDRRVFTFSDRLVEVPPRTGMACVDAVMNSQRHMGSFLGRAVADLNRIPHYRLIVISDEQSHDPVPPPVAPRAYMINPASARNGVSYQRWLHIDGFSEHVLRWIHAVEAERA